MMVGRRPVESYNLTELEIGYIAALLDGEGWFGIKIDRQPRKARHWGSGLTLKLIIGVNMQQDNTTELFAWLKEKVGGFVLKQEKRHQWKWELSGQTRVGQFLAVISPHLKVKREVAWVLSEAAGLDLLLGKMSGDPDQGLRWLQALEMAERVYRINSRNHPDRLARSLTRLNQFRSEIYDRFGITDRSTTSKSATMSRTSQTG